MSSKTYEVTATPAVETGVQQMQHTAEKAIAVPKVEAPVMTTTADLTKFNPPPLLPEVEQTTTDENHPDSVEQTITAPLQENPDTSDIATLAGETELPPRLYTIREYPCGCEAQGAGDVPAYCAEHGTPPPSPVAIQGGTPINDIIDTWFEEHFQANSFKTIERQEWRPLERQRVLIAVNELKKRLGL